ADDAATLAHTDSRGERRDVAPREALDVAREETRELDRGSAAGRLERRQALGVERVVGRVGRTGEIDRDVRLARTADVADRRTERGTRERAGTHGGREPVRDAEAPLSGEGVVRHAAEREHERRSLQAVARLDLELGTR